jgi:hypothetical protein
MGYSTRKHSRFSTATGLCVLPLPKREARLAAASLPASATSIWPATGRFPACQRRHDVRRRAPHAAVNDYCPDGAVPLACATLDAPLGVLRPRFAPVHRENAMRANRATHSAANAQLGVIPQGVHRRKLDLHVTLPSSGLSPPQASAVFLPPPSLPSPEYSAPFRA